MKIASLSLGDYTEDLVRFCRTRWIPPPLLVRITPLVADWRSWSPLEGAHGLVAACPGSAAGIFGTTTTNIRMATPFLLTGAFRGPSSRIRQQL